jgi:chromosome segregation ATPase
MKSPSMTEVRLNYSTNSRANNKAKIEKLAAKVQKVKAKLKKMEALKKSKESELASSRDRKATKEHELTHREAAEERETRKTKKSIRKLEKSKKAAATEAAVTEAAVTASLNSEIAELKQKIDKCKNKLKKKEAKLNQMEQERKLNETELQLKATTNPDEKKELREDLNRIDAGIISLRNLIAASKIEIAAKEASLTEMPKLAAAPFDPSSSGIQGDHLHPPSLTLVSLIPMLPVRLQKFGFVCRKTDRSRRFWRQARLIPMWLWTPP